MNKMTINSAGNKVWRNSQGQLHNEEGPAWILTNGSKFWCINDKNHRENGPAVIYADGEESWWIDGKKVL